MKNFAARQPGLFSLLAIILPMAGMTLARPLLLGYLSELPVRLLAEALFCVYVAGLVTALGWWREIGMNGPRNWRGPCTGCCDASSPLTWPSSWA